MSACAYGLGPKMANLLSSLHQEDDDEDEENNDGVGGLSELKTERRKGRK